ncbi:MAG: hypothetical protein ACYC3S_11660 [Chloroflexota bacterium]
MATIEPLPLFSPQRLGFKAATRAAVWAAILLVGGYLRWSYPHLTEFGIDQETAVHLGRVIRNGWEFPLAGPRLGVGAVAGPTEFYLMAVPSLVSDSPEFAAAYIGLLGLFAGLIFAVAVARHRGQAAGTAALVLFIAGPWAVYYTRKIWTPDTFPLFSACVFLLLAEGLIRRRRWALPTAGILLAAEVQLHLSALMLLPAVALILLVFIRRVRPLELLLGAVLFVIGLAPYLVYLSRTDFVDLRLVTEAAGQTPQLDLLSLEALQSLVGGIGFPGAIGIGFANGLSPVLFPAVAWLLAGAMWTGMLLVTSQVLRSLGKGPLPPAAVIGAIALLWTLVPALLNVRHSVPIYFRYELYLLPVAFYFPAVVIADAAKGAGRLWAKHGNGGNVSAAVATVLLLLIGGRGFLAVESTLRLLDAPGPVLAEGKWDVYSPPTIRESRQALTELEKIVSPWRETIVVGPVQRGPLEYLANNRYRLRFADAGNVLILPPRQALLAFLPESERLANLALKLGAVENRNVAVRWPPGDQPVRLLEVDPTRTGIPGTFTPSPQRQVLPVGLELVAYTVDNDDGRQFDLTTVWRVANADWAHNYWLYNAFVNVFAIDGKQVAAAGEVELATSSGWQQDDLLVIPTRVKLANEAQRGLYRLDLGCYVRFPARAPLAKEPGSVEVASLSSVRLGRQTAVAADQPPLATFGDTIRLATAQVAPQTGNARVAVDTVWQSGSRLERDYTLFVHVYGPDGKLVAQADGWPAEGRYPTSVWLPNEGVTDHRDLALPADLSAGTYVVKVGLYDAKTMGRLAPNPDTGDRAVAVGKIEIGR